MKNDNTNKKLTIAERMAMEAEAAGLLAQRRKLLAFLKADEAVEVAGETPAEEVETVAEVAEETPVEEVETVAKVAEETPVEEVETVAEVAEETPVDEAETVAEVAEETPVEEAETVAEVAEGTPVDEAETVAEVAEEIPVEEVESPEKVEKTSSKAFFADEVFADVDETDEISETKEDVDEEVTPENPVTADELVSTEDESNNNDDSANKTTIVKWAKRLGLIGLGILLALLLTFGLSKCNNAAAPGEGEETTTDEQQNNEEQDTTGGEQPTTPDQKFDIVAFKASVANIAAQLTEDEDINANIDIFVENIGEDKLVELIEKHGEHNTQKAIAEFVAFVPEVEMMRYVAKNELNYNPNASEDYDAKLLEAEKVYKAATGKNPDGVLMSKDWYESLKTSQTAVKAKLAEEGETALLEWYTVKTSENAVKWKQIRDTEKAQAYKDEVKLKVVNSKGSIKLLELQLEKEVNGEVVVMDNVSMKYTDSYKNFIWNNYSYVVAN